MKQQALEKRVAELEQEVYELEQVIQQTEPIEEGFWGRFSARLLRKNKKLKEENERYRKALEEIVVLEQYIKPTVIVNIANKSLKGE